VSRLQLWAGPECTVNRVGEHFFDQLERTGFADRLDDLDRLASLGVSRIRFPLLWERTAPERAGYCDWSWADARMQRLRQLDIEPIVGLLHHGSGPRYTGLLEAEFPALFADYASRVAERFPHIRAYTPINEPLTTARFSALYGLWFPHRRNDASFVRALLNQVQATVLAMQAVRAVNPDAELVQTEDLGHVSSVPKLAYQARFENQRRWLSFDLLCGHVGQTHPLWSYLTQNGATPDELQALVDKPCPPDIVGINCYVTSERFLDDRLQHYPTDMHGGNGRDPYVDAEAARVLGPFLGGPAERLRETWARYRLPVAITEVHLGCTRDEQLRWFQEAWLAAEQTRTAGCDVRAVTAWAAFGSCDWDTLVTSERGHYEPGLWDVRTFPPRPTALAKLASNLAHGSPAAHPVTAGRGWWHRADRLRYPPHGALRAQALSGQPLWITGADGMLGQACARICEMRGLPVVLMNRAALDIANAHAVEQAMQRNPPWAVINGAGFSRVDSAETDARCWRENVIGAIVLARACAARDLPILGFSSDLVFDGRDCAPYVESDSPNPLSAFGRSKFAAEAQMLQRVPRALIVRAAALFSPWSQGDFLSMGLQALRRNLPWVVAGDQWISPTYAPDLLHAALDLLIDGECGIWHLANRGAVSKSNLAQLAAAMAGLDAGGVVSVPAVALGLAAKRPRYGVLGSSKSPPLASFEDGLRRYFDEIGDIDKLDKIAPFNLVSTPCIQAVERSPARPMELTKTQV
jgi:dTDP-4-dehydrorhamnose reductase